MAKAHSSAPKIREQFALAMRYLQSGDMAGAQVMLEQIVTTQPRNFEALHCLGVLRLQVGDAEKACGLLRRALHVNPGSPEAYLNLGNALKALNKLEPALASYERVLAIKADYAEAHNNRGNVLLDLKRYEDALASYDKALAIAPGYPDARFNRGVVLQQLGRHDEALADYETVLELVPDHVEALTNRGNALQELKRHEDALASYDKALAIAPDFAEAFNNRGNALRELRRYDEALASYERAVASKSDYAEAYYNRGILLYEIKHYAEALASYERAVAIKPDYTEAYYNRGVLFHEFKRHAEALADFSRALTLAPDHVSALYMRGTVLDQQNRHEEAIRDFAHVLKLNPTDLKLSATVGNWLYSKLRICDWQGYEEETARVISGIRAGHRSIPPFFFLAISDSAEDQLSCAQIWARFEFPPVDTPVWRGERYDHDRIRIAYLSADLHDHATAYLMAGLFEGHDKARFETIAVSFGPDPPGGMRTRLKSAFDRFIDVRDKSDREVANLLRELEIDIAVDLKGFTRDSRTAILALRPAPIQVNYLGFPGTLAADYIDYILADRIVIPVEHQACYSEKVVYLPDTYQVNDSGRRIAERTPTRAEVGLPENGFVFCSFNNSYKITPAFFDIWMRLLRRIDGSVLWLQVDNAQTKRNLQREASARGVSPDKLVFAPRTGLEDHLARVRLADLFLDTLPYNAHTTASDALWAGLPVLTCLGATFAGRVAASLLHAIGLPELITPSPDEYEALALKLATDPTMLADIRAGLARNRDTHPLFDTDRFRRHIEAAYTMMWERSRRGEPPAAFSVETIPS